MHEYQMIEKALKASKIQNIDEVIRFVIMQDDKLTPKIDTSALSEYLSEMIHKEIHLCHFNVLLVVSKNYPTLITSEILDFCESNTHPVCKEILSKYKAEVDSAL